MAGPAYYTGVMNLARNEDWAVPFLYQQANGDGTFSPIDLTGSTLSLEIRTVDVDPQVFVLVSSDNNNGIFITDPVNGLFTIVISRNDMIELPPGTYVADLVRLMTSGYVERILDCAVNVAEGVTR